MKKAADYLWTAIVYGLPGLLGAFLISRYGLLWVCAVLMAEFVLMLLYKHWNRQSGKPFRPMPGVIVSTIGTGFGAAFYPVQSDPAALGIAVLLLTMLVHAVLYLIMEALIKP